MVGVYVVLQEKDVDVKERNSPANISSYHQSEKTLVKPYPGPPNPRPSEILCNIPHLIASYSPRHILVFHIP